MGLTRGHRSHFREGILEGLVRSRHVLSILAAGALVVGANAALAPPVLGVQIAHDRVVSAAPAPFTPNVLDGQVNAIVQVGNTMIIGGAFSQVQAAGSTTTLTRNNILAFSATTGALSTTFVPSFDGEVTSLLVAPDGLSVYAGGFFNNVNGQASQSLARLNVSNGQRTAGFTPPSMNGRVKDIKLSGGRLWIGGTFQTVSGVSRPSLATLNPATGARDPYMNLPITGVHNGGANQLLKFDITPDGSKLVGIGNFTQVDGQDRRQIFMLDLTGPAAALANWQTNFYTSTCASVFNTYMRDLDISPEGSYFVVSTTGAYRAPPSACDTHSRFETGATGTGITPTWVNYTGGDTTYAVAITGVAVYVGGHFRWANNPLAGDSAGPGAVSRQGIAALDPSNGLPLTWNPGRTLGVGVFDMLATPQGLWVGSDTDRIGNFSYRARIALMPLAGGTVIPPRGTGVLPGDVYQAGQVVVPGDPSVLYRVNAGGPTVPATVPGPDWSADNGTTNPLRNSGSNVAAWTGTVPMDASVPANTPPALFNHERWDPSALPEMEWNFAAAAGTPLQVRLYFANRCTCTSLVGQRRFNVNIDGTPRLTNYDIVADVGDQRGVMKAYNITSDGNVDIDFGHVTENPLINAIEIIRTDIPPVTVDLNQVNRRSFDGDVPGATTTLAPTGISWGQARGGVMINGTLYYGWSDGNFYSRTFNGSTFGAQVAVNTHDLLVQLASWHADVPNITSMFYDDSNGRLFYTLAGQTSLFYRGFTPQNNVVSTLRFTASTGVAGVNFADAAGAFLAAGKLYIADRTNGALTRVDWANGAPVNGTATVVSSPGIDGADWRARAMFLYAPVGGAPVNQNPVANATVNCTGLACTFNGTGSSDPDGGIVSWAWNFGDGATATGATTSHTYASAGTYSVQLTVTDDNGGTDSVTNSIVVSEPSTPVSFVGAANSNGNATSRQVTRPAAVTTGDGMLLFGTVASATVTMADPAGWTPVRTVLSASGITTRLWQRVATAGEPATVTVTLSALAKADVTLLAYRGTAAAGPVGAHQGVAETATTGAHVTPQLTTASTAWIVSYWADNSSATTAWTAPGGQTVRNTLCGTGGGRICSLTTDSGAPVGAGNQGGLTATADSASGKATMWTVALTD
jgi:PKD repeat protein